MPQLVASPTVGQQVTDSGWQYEWTGDRWISNGYVNVFNPFGGFAGPFTPSITDASMISWIRANDQHDRSPWAGGPLSASNVSTNIWSNSDDTTGAWVVMDRYNNSDTQDNSNILISMSQLDDGSFQAGSTVSGNVSLTEPSSGSFFSTYKLYETGGAFDKTGDVTTSTSSNRDIDTMFPLQGRVSNTDLDAGYIDLSYTTTTNSAAEGMADVDQIEFQFVANSLLTGGGSMSSSFFSSDVITGANDPDPGLVELRRGDLLMDAWWIRQSATATGSLTKLTDTNAGVYHVRVYEAYCKVTP